MNLRAGVIGAGAAGLLHALSYRAHGVTVAAVFDPDTERARGLAEICGATVFRDLDALAQSDLDCVSVCSPPVNHVEQALTCARAGRIVFVEKPVAVSRRELARLSRAPGCVPIVQWRWGRAVRAVRRAIALGMLGPAPSVLLDLAWGRDAAYLRARAGWGCGALLSVGIHALDAVCFALDRPVTEVACARGPDGCHNEGTAVLIASFEGGASAALRVTFDAGPDESRLSFCGEGVTAAIVGGESDPTASSVIWRCDDAPTLRSLTELERSTEGSVHSPLLVPFLGRALDACRRDAFPGECDALPSIGDVLAAHDLAMRAYESAPVIGGYSPSYGSGAT